MRAVELVPLIEDLTVEDRNLIRLLARHREIKTILEVIKGRENEAELFGVAITELIEREAIPETLKMVIDNEGLITSEAKIVQAVLDSFE